MISVFIYRLKILIKNKELMFWVILFPILLVTLFNMAFSNFGEFGFVTTLNVRDCWRCRIRDGRRLFPSKCSASNEYGRT